MKTFAATFFSLEADSSEAAHQAANSLKTQFAGKPLKSVMVYATMNHDHAALLATLRAELPPDVLLIGSSGQGVVAGDELTEEGMALGVIGFGGDALRCASAVEREVEVSPLDKGSAIGRSLKEQLGAEPKIAILFYDPLSGVDVEAIIAGVRTQLTCPLVGAGSGQPWGRPIETAQFWNSEALTKGVVALALSGPFDTEIGLCHGTAPTGISSVVTKAVGNHVFEIDGRSAAEIWREVTGCKESDMLHQSHFASWAVGVERSATVAGPNGVEVKTSRVIRGAFGFDMETGAMILQAAIPEGTKIMLHHRTVDEVLSGTTAMAGELTERLKGRSPWAVLGFECGARTYPFLGPANTRNEHLALRGAIAPKAPWLGMMAWGEIGPCVGQTSFHNYTYPLVTFLDAPG